MTRDELVELLGAHEWRDVEFKEARTSETGLVTDQAAVPKGGLVTAGVTNLTEHQETIMCNCDLPRTRAELMERVVTESGLVFLSESKK